MALLDVLIVVVSTAALAVGGECESVVRAHRKRQPTARSTSRFHPLTPPIGLTKRWVTDNEAHRALSKRVERDAAMCA